jgi:hypothetical protein
VISRVNAWFTLTPRAAFSDRLPLSLRTEAVRRLARLASPLVALGVIGLVACSGGGKDEADAVMPAPAARNGALALVYRADDKATLARLDPVSLRVLGGRTLDLGDFQRLPALSPDGRLLAVADAVPSGEVRIVDLSRMRVVASFDAGAASVRDELGALAWLGEHLVAVAVEDEPGGFVVKLIEPRRGQVVESDRLPGPLWVRQSATSSRRLVLLLGRSTQAAFSPTLIAVVDADRGVRTISLTRLPSGSIEDGPIDRSLDPGLAVDSEGERAFVVGAGAPVAEIDLETMEVRYHEPAERVALLDRLLDWLEPDAHAKGPTETSFRQAVWLGNGHLAVTGADTDISVRDDGEVEERTIPAGLSLIDTDRWAVRTLDERASDIALAENALIAWTYPTEFVPRKPRESGLIVYELDGRERFRLSEDKAICDLQAGGRFAYVGIGSCADIHVVDLESGEVLRRVERKAWPQILARRSRP